MYDDKCPLCVRLSDGSRMFWDDYLKMLQKLAFSYAKKENND